jgi:RNA polymerase sigma-70 factor (ECF subfamily)
LEAGHRPALTPEREKILDRSDEDWVTQLSAREPAAVEDLRSYLVRGLMKALSGRADAHAVEDFAQDAVLKVLAGLESFRGDSRFTTWALTIAIRVAFSELRKARYRDVPLEALAEEQAAPAPEPADEGALATLRRLIETSLTDRQRALVQAELAGVPQAVIAERMGTNRNALYKLGHDARMKLKDGLLAAGFTAEQLGGEK